MHLPDVFSATLGLSDYWKITDVSFAPAEKRIDITVAFTQAENIRCPICGTLNNICHTVDETWFHSDFFSHATYLHTQTPYIQCCELLPVERPWSRKGSKFSQLN